MKLVIEAGATKSIFLFLDKGKLIEDIATSGYNMAHQTIDLLFCPRPKNYKAYKINNIFYYGAGVISEEHKSTIAKRLSQEYTVPLEHCYIYNDLMAVAHAGLKDKAGLLAILGTGSSAAYYDGKNIVERSPNLGYICTDEGSGHEIGKELLKAYFYQTMPAEVQELFDKTYSLDRASFINTLYSHQAPSAYLASFVRFLDKIEENNSWKTNLLNQIFEGFIKTKLFPIADKYENKKLVIVGSVGYYYQDILSTICADYGIKDTFSIKNPIDGLIEYHTVHND